MTTGKNKEGSDVAGSIKVPECAYDTEEEEFVVWPLTLTWLGHVLTGSTVRN
jgi:hypothetical protein